MKKYTFIVTVLLLSVSLSGLYANGKSSPFSSLFDFKLGAGSETVSSKDDAAAKKKILELQKKADEEAAKEEKEALKKAAEEAKKAEKNRLAEEAAAQKAAEKARKEEERIAAAAEKKRLADEKAAALKAAKEELANFAGFGEAAEKNPFSVTFGIIKFDVVPNRGTFNISVTHEGKKSTPVFTTTNEFNTTSFYLRKDNRIIQLNQNLGLRRAARKTEKGVQIAYQIDNLAFVLVDFSCFNSVEGGDIDTVKVTATVKSLYTKKADFDVKLVMDTELGETSQNHFYKYDDTPITQEMKIHSAKELPWFVSKNTQGNIQFLFGGFDTTPISELSLANYATIGGRVWSPNVNPSRTFDNVLAYNNSAVGVIWNKHTISADEKFSEVFYLSLSNTAKTPTGDVFIDANSDEKLVKDGFYTRDGQFVATKAEEKPATEDKEVKTEVVISYEIPGDKAKPIETNIGSGIKSSKKTGRLKSVQSESGKATISADGSTVTVKPVTKEQLTPEYIQKLLDRIAAIEASGESVDREELIKLNAELDAILEYLRK